MKRKTSALKRIKVMSIHSRQLMTNPIHILLRRIEILSKNGLAVQSTRPLCLDLASLGVRIFVRHNAVYQGSETYFHQTFVG